jgi:RND family efflux transporter MFP subunit
MSVPADSPQHPQLNRLKRFALLVLVLAILVAAWGIYSRLHARAGLAESAREAAIPVVDVVSPRRANLANRLVLPGSVQAFTDSPIYARTSGYLKRWYTDIGAHVKQGELLAEIETPDIDAQYHQAQADYATAQANNRLAQITAERYQKLRKSGLVAQQDVDNAQGDADAKKAQLDSARQNVQRYEELESFNRIVAPFDGVVTARNTDVGALVNAGASTGQELFHMTATRRLRVYVQVPQAYAVLMQPGLHAELIFPERPDRRFPAQVVSTARSIDNNTRTLLTELSADNEKGEMLPGSFAQVQLPLPPGLESWRLPSNTLLYRGDGLHVATVDPYNRTQLNVVQVGRDFGTEIEILSGVNAQDRVIVNPPDSLYPGVLVKVHNASQTSAGGAARAPAG